MDTSIVFTKTAKGVIELKAAGKNLTSLLAATLQRIDGRSSIGALTTDLNPHGKQVFEGALAALEKQNLIKVFTRDMPPIETAGATEVSSEQEMPLAQIEELSAEEGVRAWAEARRGSQQLIQKGFYATAHIDPDGNIVHRYEVVIVEDDDAIAQLMKTYLVRRGFLVRTAADGLEALQLLDSTPVPDLVLLDVNLPNINGFDVLAYMRAHATLGTVPAIMVTAQVSDADVLRGLKGQADGYIFKPFEWAALLACMHQVLGIPK